MTRDTIHGACLVASVSAIGYGLWAIFPPLAPLGIGALILTGIIYARTVTHGKSD